MVGKLIKLTTREVKGCLSYTRNSNFAGCISQVFSAYSLLLVTWHQSSLVLLSNSSVRLLVLLHKEMYILSTVTLNNIETSQTLDLSSQPVWACYICLLPKTSSIIVRHPLDQCCFRIILCSPTCFYWFLCSAVRGNRTVYGFYICSEPTARTVSEAASAGSSPAVKPAGQCPAPVPGWCVLVNIGVSWEHCTIQSTPKLQSLLFCSSAFKTWSKDVRQQCHLLTPENILSSGHTLISKAIYGAIIWANTVPVTENPLMMMNSSYWWLQPDPQWWVGGKTLALKLCELPSVSRSGFHKGSRKKNMY